MSASLIISCLTYETAVPLALFVPLLLLRPSALSKGGKRLAAAIWYLSLLSYLLFYFTRPLLYQSKRLSEGLGVWEFLLEVVKSNLLAFKQGFWDGWVDAVHGLVSAPRFLIFAGLVAIVASLVLTYLARHSKKDDGVNNRQYGGLILAGLAIFGLGFSLYSLTNIRYDQWRVFYYAAIGGGIAVAAGVTLLANKWGRGRLFIPVSALLIFVAANVGLVQHSLLVGTSEAQQSVLSAMVGEVPNVVPNAVFIVSMDHISLRPFPNNTVFSNAVSWVYGKEIQVRMCYQDRENCSIEQGILIVNDIQQPELSGAFSAEDLLVFEYTQETGPILLGEHPLLEGYAPAAQITEGALPLLRVSSFEN
jgi:hypothetical protein